jgi:hypothetical protein
MSIGRKRAATTLKEGRMSRMAAVFAGMLITLGAGTAANACQIWAQQPSYLNASIAGEGAWVNCPEGTKVTVLLRQDKRWWPDSTLAVRAGIARFGTLTATRPCGTGFEFMKVYVEVRSGDTKTQSGRSLFPCS